MKSTALEHLQPNLYAGRERAGKIAVFDVLDGKKDVEPKHGMRGTTRLVLLAMLVLAATGCATIGPASISHGRSTYNAVINRTEDEQTLSMIVHQRYDETFGMLVVSNVTASLRGRATVGGNAGIGPSENYAGNLVPLSAEATYEENPTITYVPLRGEQFLQRMLAPLTAEQVLLLSRMSNDEIEVFRLLVRRANDLVNPLYSSRPANQDFDRFLDLYAQLREAGKLDIVKSPDGQFALLLHDYSAEESKAMDELLVRAEYTAGHQARVEALRATMRERLRARLGVHPVVDLVPEGTLPRTEFKARRVIDDRDLYRRGVTG